MVTAGYLYYRSFADNEEKPQISEEYSKIWEFQSENVDLLQDTTEETDFVEETAASTVDHVARTTEAHVSDDEDQFVEPSPKKIAPTVHKVTEDHQETQEERDDDEAQFVEPSPQKTDPDPTVLKLTEEQQETQEERDKILINELKNEADFEKIDPECVDTPAFYGGEFSLFVQLEVKT